MQFSGNLDFEKIFFENLAFLKQNFPELYEEINNYFPNAALIIDPQKGWNIYNQEENTFLYPYDGKTLTYKQLAEWLQKPSFLSLAAEEILGNPNWLHVEYINKLVNIRKEILKTNKISLGKETIPYLIVVGVGLGFHIDFLLRNFPIENLVILEPNKDFFYISLHLINWKDLLKPFIEDQRKSINIFIGNKVFDLMEIIPNFIHKEPFKLSTIFIYPHYLTPEISEFLKKLNLEIERIISMFGFFDDEITSLKHTLLNIKNQIPLFNPIGKTSKIKPKIGAAIVGSGPSLEFLIPILKKYRHKLFVISCGTALGVLEKHQITPDLHVNIERNELPYRVILKTTSEDFRKKIPFLGANNNFPEIFHIFGKSAFFLKGKDAGASLFENKQPLMFVNPTVANTGLAISYYLGFSKVFLFGIDLAFIQKKHHVRGSYYDFNPDLNHLYKEEVEVPGNFGGIVPTKREFYISIKILEEAINFFQKEQENFRVFNPNLGAKIEGATPVKIHQLEEILEELPMENINNYTHLFWNTYLEHYNLQDFNFPQKKIQLMTNFYQLKQVITSDLTNISSYKDYKEFFENLYGYIFLLLKHNPILFHLLHGTLNLFLAHAYVGLYTDVSNELKHKYLKGAIGIMEEMLNKMEQEIYNLYSFFPF